MHHIKAEWFLFHVMYVTQLFFLVTYDSICKGSTQICFSKPMLKMGRAMCAKLQPFWFQLGDGRSFKAILRFDTEVELRYFQHGGILNYMIHMML